MRLRRGLLAACSVVLVTATGCASFADTAAEDAGAAAAAASPTEQAVDEIDWKDCTSQIDGLIEDDTPGKRVYDPKHPLADPTGYVTQSNVNVVEEMVNMISASRSYQNNLEVMNTAKTLLLKTIQLGQG